MRILYLLTRSPFGQASGRKAVQRTVLRSLKSLGHDVELCIFDESRDAPEAVAGACHWLGRPGPLKAGWNSLIAAIGGGRSINEALYRCPARRTQVQRLAVDGGFDLVIADMIRLAPYAASTGLPWVLDLDDLLSERYAGYLAEGGSRESLLGYYGRGLPGPLRRLAGWMAGALLRREQRLLTSRETHWARTANAVTLVSAAEAGRLAARIGRDVHAMPMAVDIPAPVVAGGATRADRAVFVGGLDYQPNLDALRYYAREVHPALVRQGTDVVLDVVGNADPEQQLELSGANVEFLGYVDDIMATLTRYRVFVAPLVSGTGIKTKVLEAMAAGLGVITTPSGVIGLDVRHGEHCFVARTPREMATQIAEAVARPEIAQDIGERARHYVDRHFSHPVLKSRWRALLAGLEGDGMPRDHAA
jgi:glycosyltransferase involved in cell wall biosynthesis